MSCVYIRKTTVQKENVHMKQTAPTANIGAFAPRLRIWTAHNKARQVGVCLFEQIKSKRVSWPLSFSGGENASADTK